MKTFEKYIPVDKNDVLTDGDQYMHSNFPGLVFIYNTSKNYMDTEKFIKVKLYLCTQEIKEGDEVVEMYCPHLIHRKFKVTQVWNYETDSTVMIGDDTESVDVDHVFKIIEEIVPKKL